MCYRRRRRCKKPPKYVDKTCYCNSRATRAYFAQDPSKGTNFPSCARFCGIPDTPKVDPLLLKMPPPRISNGGCVLEIALLEKHSDHCKHKKKTPSKWSKDDKIGDYFVVGRITYQMCARPCQKGREPKTNLSEAGDISVFESY